MQIRYFYDYKCLNFLKTSVKKIKSCTIFEVQRQQFGVESQSVCPLPVTDGEHVSLLLAAGQGQLGGIGHGHEQAQGQTSVHCRRLKFRKSEGFDPAEPVMFDSSQGYLLQKSGELRRATVHCPKNNKNPRITVTPSMSRLEQKQRYMSGFRVRYCIYVN